ncbi:MAG: hypothetical protein ABI361_09765 [Nitrososphaera sp.]|jgi:NhaP-type Na+/H+ and K+/H+ antiporter
MSSAYERELASWNAFSVFLKNENKELFTEMLSETRQFIGAFNAKEQMPQEAFLMTVILANQKMIDMLEQQVENRRKNALTANRDKGSLDYYLKPQDERHQDATVKLQDES